MKKVAIVGTGPSWILTPFKDPEMEVWYLNEMEIHNPPMPHRWFQIHSLAVANADHNPEHTKHLAKLKIPVYMQKHYPEIPASIPLPKDVLTERFGTYFGCTASWAVALAIDEGFREIHLYGLDFPVFYMDREPNGYIQRASIEHKLGMAQALGIKVVLPPSSTLLKTPKVYGYEE
ncbi:MAG: hypothetical protein M0R06_13255 [Sphaerochaeta sp.]|jgi:hypothetical protein|nr:hypothetical protein [Sphaerochaeta sp.]